MQQQYWQSRDGDANVDFRIERENGRTVPIVQCRVEVYIDSTELAHTTVTTRLPYAIQDSTTNYVSSSFFQVHDPLLRSHARSLIAFTQCYPIFPRHAVLSNDNLLVAPLLHCMDLE